MKVSLSPDVIILRLTGLKAPTVFFAHHQSHRHADTGHGYGNCVTTVGLIPIQ